MGERICTGTQAKPEFNLAPFTSTQLVCNSRTEKNKLIDLQRLRTSLVPCHQMGTRENQATNSPAAGIQEFFSANAAHHRTPLVLITSASAVAARKTARLDVCAGRAPKQRQTLPKRSELTDGHTEQPPTALACRAGDQSTN